MLTWLAFCWQGMSVVYFTLVLHMPLILPPWLSSPGGWHLTICYCWWAAQDHVSQHAPCTLLSLPTREPLTICQNAKNVVFDLRWFIIEIGKLSGCILSLLGLLMHRGLFVCLKCIIHFVIKEVLAILKIELCHTSCSWRTCFCFYSCNGQMLQF